MKRYVALSNGHERVVEIEPKGGDLFEISIDGGEPHLLDACKLATGTLSIIVDRQSYAVDIEEVGTERLNVLLRGSIFSFELLDERRMRMRQAKSGFTVSGRQTVAAPMPGKVVKILCSPGQEVQEGQGLIVIEAMKMENELQSPKAGKVVEIHAKEGQAVEGGTALVVVE